MNDLANLLFDRSTAQMIRQLLTESLLLAVLGGATGTLLAGFGLQTLAHFSPQDLPRVWEGIHLDGWTLGYTALITLAAGMVFGLVPAFQSSNFVLAGELNEGLLAARTPRNEDRS